MRYHFSESGVTPNSVLFGGTVPPNSALFGGTVPPNSVLFGGTVRWVLFEYSNIRIYSCYTAQNCHKLQFSTMLLCFTEK